jgi:hypothetical protein
LSFDFFDFFGANLIKNLSLFSKGSRVKCSVCKMAAHVGCSTQLQEQFPCKITFIQDVRGYR